MSCDKEFNIQIIDDRLKTFDEWPLLAPSGREMAEAGFYYLQEADKVTCAYCNATIDNWGERDIPIFEHAKRSPSCQFIKDRSQKKKRANLLSCFSR